MQTVPLLNPRSDAAIARRMLGHVEARMAAQAKALTSAVLDRETYLLTLGAHIELSRLHTALTTLYEKETRA